MTPRVRFDEVAVEVAGRALLQGVSFDLAAGDKAVLRGRSGAGKSTLLKTLLGLYCPTSGRILVDGLPMSPEHLGEIRARIAYVGQEPLLGAATVRDALLLPFTFKAHRAAKPPETEVEAVMRRLGLAPALLSQPGNRISGGEKQRLAIARAQLLGKTLYLLDEVTSALDEISRSIVLEFFSDPALTVLSVSHDPVWIARCTTVFDIVEGHVRGPA